MTTATSRRARRRASLLASAAAAVAFGSLLLASSALAAGTPGSGPTAGGTTVSFTLPGVVFAPTQISVADDYALAIDGDGTVVGWGSNADGQLGAGVPNPATAPTAIPGLPAAPWADVVVASSGFSLALGTDGRLWTWGNNAQGQLGHGTVGGTGPPAVVNPVGVSFTAVAAGTTGSHTLALASDGTIWAWGANSHGQLGDGTTIDRSAPVQVDASGVGSPVFTAVSNGGSVSMALDAVGTLYHWGAIWVDDGLGGVVPADAPTPVPVDMTGLPGVGWSSVSVNRAHAVAVSTTGEVHAFGIAASDSGVESSSSIPTPIDVSGLPVGTTFTQVLAASDFNLGLAASGALYAWGHNGAGQLGDGTTTTSWAPVGVVGIPAGSVVSFGASFRQGSAVLSDGSLLQWGIVHGPTPVDTLPIATLTMLGAGFDGVVASAPILVSGTTWSVQTPPHAAGVVDVVVAYRVSTKAGMTIETYPASFEYRDAPPAIATTTLVAVTSPSTAPIVGPADVTLTAVVTAADASDPTGSVLLCVAVSTCRSVAVSDDGAGHVTAAATFAAVAVGTYTPSAVFTATGSYSDSAGTTTLAVLATGSGGGGGGGGTTGSSGVTTSLAFTGNRFLPVLGATAAGLGLVGALIVAANAIARSRVARAGARTTTTD